jgi:hypothetical protein
MFKEYHKLNQDSPHCSEYRENKMGELDLATTMENMVHEHWIQHYYSSAVAAVM